MESNTHGRLRRWALPLTVLLALVLAIGTGWWWLAGRAEADAAPLECSDVTAGSPEVTTQLFQATVSPPVGERSATARLWLSCQNTSGHSLTLQATDAASTIALQGTAITIGTAFRISSASSIDGFEPTPADFDAQVTLDRDGWATVAVVISYTGLEPGVDQGNAGVAELPITVVSGNSIDQALIPLATPLEIRTTA